MLRSPLSLGVRRGSNKEKGDIKKKKEGQHKDAELRGGYTSTSSLRVKANTASSTSKSIYFCYKLKWLTKDGNKSSGESRA